MRPIRVYVALVVALLLPAAALAQDRTASRAAPFHTSEEVIVTQSTSGQELRGHIVELSPTTLAMLVNGTRIDLPLESVLRIDSRNDSVKNGAAIGAAVMGGYTALGCGLGFGDTAYCVTYLIVNTGAGALLGAGIDALHKGRTTIYSKPPAVTLGVAPAGKGATARLTVRW